MDIGSLLLQMLREGKFRRIASNPRAQFGRPNKRYLGARLMPERTVRENAYREHRIRYRTLLANDGTRYSPVQKKGNELVGSFLVELFDQDVGSEFTSVDYDNLIDALARNASMDGMAQLTNWLDLTINLALIEKIEQARWQVIVDAIQRRRGDNGYAEDVQHADPPGHRVMAGADWSDDAYDPFDDIFAGVDKLTGLGYGNVRAITGQRVVSIMAGNAKVKQRTSLVTINQGVLDAQPGRADEDLIRRALERNNIRGFDKYDATYNTGTGNEFFLPRDVMVLVGSTQQQEQVDLGDRFETVEDTIGYVGVGRATGQTEPGRVIRSEHKEDRPPRIEAEGWQTSAPVMTTPEAVYVIKGIQ